MLKQISYLDKIIIIIFSLLLIVDSANGFLLLSGVSSPITLSQLVKMPIIFLMIFRVFILNKSFFAHILILILFLLLSWCLNYMLLSDFNITLEFSVLLKLIIIPISMYYFVSISRLNFEYFLSKIKQIFVISFAVVIINILIGLAGFGFNSYVEGIGSKGFFFAGNELSVLYVVLLAFLLLYTFKNYSKAKYAIASVLGLFFGLFIATKVTMFSILMLMFIIPLVSIKWKITTKKIIGVSVSLVLFASLSVMVYNYLFISGLIDKWTYFLKIYDYNYVSIILSGRDRFLEQAYLMSIENSHIIHEMFGYSYTGYVSLIKQSTTLHGQSIEMDFFDIYFFYGLFGLFAVLSFWFVGFYAYFKNGAKNHVILFTSILVLAISFLSGHVLFSGMSGPFIGILLSLLFQKELFRPKETAL